MKVVKIGRTHFMDATPLNAWTGIQRICFTIRSWIKSNKKYTCRISLNWRWAALQLERE